MGPELVIGRRSANRETIYLEAGTGIRLVLVPDFGDARLALGGNG
jgi:hypothetical protein